MHHPATRLALIGLLIASATAPLAPMAAAQSAPEQTSTTPATTTSTPSTTAAPGTRTGVSPSPDSLHCTHPGNCVSTAGQWAVAPLEAFSTAPQAREALLRTLAASPEARIVRDEPLYIDVIFTTTLGFKDQVEFIIDPQGRRIDFRSRSQIGLWDLGMNRRRMGALRARFEQMQGR
jgi:uncharacterized protein (DUF1499 family)